MPDSPNGRTHEPALRELVADLDGLKDLLLRQLEDLRELFGQQNKGVREILDERRLHGEERDRRYEERFRAQEAATGVALSAQKELTLQSFTSAEKAITKAEHAQTIHNQLTNEFRGQLDDQAKLFIARTESLSMHAGTRERIDRDRDETRQMHDALKTDISALREAISKDKGRDEQQGSGRLQANWVIGLVVVGSIGVASFAVSLLNFLTRVPGVAPH